MENRKKIIFIAGDSTAETKTENERPESGWGEFLGDYLSSDLFVKNHAMGGRSTKSFLEQNRLDPILNEMKQGDYLIIQFGHNDQKMEDPERYTDPKSTYQENLKYFVSKAREKQAHPILISSISRRDFNEGKINRESLGAYPTVMKKVAKDEHVVFIDMHRISATLLEELGEEKSKAYFLHLEKGEHKNYPDGLTDNTHFSEEGARVFAQLIAKELANQFKEITLK